MPFMAQLEARTKVSGSKKNCFGDYFTRCLRANLNDMNTTQC